MNDVFLLYTTETGGLFEFGDPARYGEAVQTGRLDVTPPSADPDEPRVYVEPCYICLVKKTEGYDFVLGRNR